MKAFKSLLILLIAVMLLFAVSSCASNTAPGSTDAEPLENTESEETSSNDIIEIDIPKSSDSEETHDPDAAALEIPVYPETDLLFDTNGMYFLGRDAGYYAGTNAMVNEAGAILAAYPTDAIRTKENGGVYTVYDTDTGYRFYMFFDKNNDYSIPVGFPIVIKNLLSLSDFSDLKVGDSIEAVEKIDPVATLYKRTITEVWQLNPIGASNYAEEGVPCTSIHYLTDGLLVIEYEMLENGDLVISGIKHSENYILTDILGNDIDYSIYDVDLPG